MSLSYGFCLGEPSTEYNSAQFSDVFHAVIGDGITPYGSKFALNVNGFTATIASGYALAKGRWLKNDEPLALSVKSSGNNKDRTDAIAARVDYESRKVSAEILVNVDRDEILANPSLLRNDKEYNVFLYFIRVKRGATSLTPNDITDLRANKELCGTIRRLSDVSAKALYAYDFLIFGIDEEAERLLALLEALSEKCDEKSAELIALENEVARQTYSDIAKLEAGIQSVGKTGVGELMTSRVAPSPVKEWLLCNGESVPEEYPILFTMLDGVLPALSQPEDRYRTYIYGGKPTEQE